jgi:hypothetical protein
MLNGRRLGGLLVLSGPIQNLQSAAISVTLLCALGLGLNSLCVFCVAFVITKGNEPLINCLRTHSRLLLKSGGKYFNMPRDCS